MQPFEVLILRRPVSFQSKNRKNLQAWKSFVRSEATIAWDNRGVPVSSPALRCTIVYLCGEAPADIDNIIKPIQDSLVGLVFNDDSLVSSYPAAPAFTVGARIETVNDSNSAAEPNVRCLPMRKHGLPIEVALREVYVCHESLILHLLRPT